MTTEQRGKIVDVAVSALKERLAVARWFRHNACAKHGLPLDDPQPLEVNVKHEYTGTPPVAPEAKPEPSPGIATAVVAPVVKKGLGMAAGLALGGLGGLALAAGGYVLNQYFNRPEVVEAQPVEEKPIEAVPATGSLLQFLQDTGQHLPVTE